VFLSMTFFSDLTLMKQGWAYNVSKSAVVNATRCMSSCKASIRIMCLCPSVTTTPILEGCSKKELEEMREQVGGFMNSVQVFCLFKIKFFQYQHRASLFQVGEGFISLLETGSSGSVMSLWVDSPPYLIPDTSMMQFIMMTACAMAFR